MNLFASLTIQQDLEVDIRASLLAFEISGARKKIFKPLLATNKRIMFKFNVLLAFSFVEIAVAGGHGPADTKLDVWDANLLQRRADSHAGTIGDGEFVSPNRPGFFSWAQYRLSASLAESFNAGDTNNETVANNLAFTNDPVQVNMMFSVIASASETMLYLLLHGRGNS